MSPQIMNSNSLFGGARFLRNITPVKLLVKGDARTVHVSQVLERQAVSEAGNKLSFNVKHQLDIKSDIDDFLLASYLKKVLLNCADRVSKNKPIYV